MKLAARLIALCAILLSASIPLHAQMAAVQGGRLDIAFTNFGKILKDQGVQVLEEANETHGGLTVTGGQLDLTTGSGEVTSRGSLDFITYSGIFLELRDLTLVTDGDDATITAHVVLNGVSHGRHAVFTVLAGPVYPLPLGFGPFKNPALRFTYTAEFWAGFSELFNLGAVTQPESAGDFAVRIKIDPLVSAGL